MIAVTGATGFVGSTVLARLGANAIGITRADWADLPRALTGATAIVHAASVVHRPGASASEYEDFNTRGTSQLIDAARAVGAKHVVFLSSIKVYGEEPEGDIDERTPIASESPYASSKAAAERLLEASGIPTTILRLCPVFGVGDKGNVRKVATAIAKRRFAMPGDGSTRKSIVHVSAVARAVEAAVARPINDTFVIADPVVPTMRELADTIAAQLHRRKPRSVPIPLLMAAAGAFEVLSKLRRRPASVSRELIAKSLRPTVCSPAKFERAYGMSLHVDLADALAEEISWLRRDGLI